MKNKFMKKTLYRDNGVNVAMHLRTGETTFKIQDIYDPTLAVGIGHVSRKNESGDIMWSTTLDQTLRKNEQQQYVYTDASGEEYVFLERYYSLDGNGGKEKLNVATSEVLVDTEGKLWYEGKEIFRELYTNEGLTAKVRLEGVQNAEWLEQRYEEEKETEEQLKALESTLCDFVLVRKDTGEQKFTLSKESLESVESFTDFLIHENYSETTPEEITTPLLLLRKEEAVTYQTLYQQKAAIQADYDSIYRKAEFLKEKYLDPTNMEITMGVLELALDQINLFVFDTSTAPFHPEVNRLTPGTLTQLADKLRLQLIPFSTQMDSYTRKDLDYREELKDMYKDYLLLKSKFEDVKRHAPVSVLTTEAGILAFNDKGNLVAIVADKQKAVSVVWESCQDGTERIHKLQGEKENSMVFSYEDGNLTQVVNSQGDTVRFEYSEHLLTAIHRDIFPDINITYYNNEVSMVSIVGQEVLSFTHTSEGALQKLSCETSISKITNEEIVYRDLITGSITEREVINVVLLANATHIDYKHGKEKEVFRFYEEAQPMYVEYYDAKGGVVEFGEQRSYDVRTDKLLTHEILAPACVGMNIESLYPIVWGDRTVYTYNDFNELVKTQAYRYPVEGRAHGLNARTTTEYAYNAEGKPTLVKATTEEFYGSDTPTKTIVSYESTAYNSAGNPVRVESYTEGKETVLGKDITEIVYNDEGVEVKRITYNTLAPSDKTYTESETDEKGRTLFDLDVTGKHKTEYSYFADGSLAAEHYPSGGTLAYAYDKEGNTVSVTASTADGEGNTNVTHYTAGLVTRVESGNHVVDYEYDGKRRLTKIKLDGADYETYTYTENEDGSEIVSTAYAKDDPVLTVTKDARGNTTGYVFDGVMNVTSTYSSDNRITQSTDSVSGRTCTYTYDDEKRLSDYADSRGVTEEMTFDEKGRLNTRTETVIVDAATGAEHVADYTVTYDDNGRVSFFENTGFDVTPKLDALGRLRKNEVYIGVDLIQEETYRYLKHDNHTTNRPQEIIYYSESDDERLKYFYDEMGNISKITENGIVTCRYEYDALGRLTREDNRAFNKTCLWDYDCNGNILLRCEWAFSLMSTEELKETEPVATAPYLYDGDLLWSYAGNSRFLVNKYKQYTRYNGTGMSWTGARYLKKYNGKAITYAGDSLCASINERSLYYDRNGRLVADDIFHYLYDHTERLLGFVNKATPTETYFYRLDAQGNVRAILDKGGNVVVKYRYDAWGNHLVQDAEGAEITDLTHVGHLNPFRYRSYYYSEDLGLYYLKSRFYDPVTGRFISPDATSYLAPDTVNGLNLYAYCNNNPVMNVDPEGHAWWNVLAWIGVGLVAVAAGALLLSCSLGLALSGGLLSTAISDAAIGSLIGSVGGAVAGAVGGAIYSAIAGEDLSAGVWTGMKIGFGAGAIIGAFVGGAVGVQSWYNMRAGEFTNLGTSNEVILGKYIYNSPHSYEAVAAKRNATYFGTSPARWHEVETMFGVGEKGMWRINKIFLKQQAKAGKQFLITSDYISGYLYREVSYITSKGLQIFLV